MTTAVCIRCGEIKFGSFVPCPKCGFEPKEDVDRAKAILLSDHHLPGKEIERVSALIRGGERVEVETDLVGKYMEAFRHPDVAGAATGRDWGCIWMLAVLVAVGLALGFLVAKLF